MHKKSYAYYSKYHKKTRKNGTLYLYIVTQKIKLILHMMMLYIIFYKINFVLLILLKIWWVIIKFVMLVIIGLEWTGFIKV